MTVHNCMNPWRGGFCTLVHCIYPSMRDFNVESQTVQHHLAGEFLCNCKQCVCVCLYCYYSNYICGIHGKGVVVEFLILKYLISCM